MEVYPDESIFIRNVLLESHSARTDLSQPIGYAKNPARYLVETQVQEREVLLVNTGKVHWGGSGGAEMFTDFGAQLQNHVL